MVRVVIEVPDASHLQLLADGLAEAANMRTRAAGVAARQVLEDPAITDKRSDATKLLQVVADADWIRTVAEQLPMLVLADAPAPAAADPSAAVLEDLTGGHVTAPPPAAAPAPPPPGPGPDLRQPFARGRGHDFDMPEDAAARLRALTVPPGARLRPGDPSVETPDPPAAAAQAQAHLEALAGGDGADVFYDGS
jgi:hypothetical protein